MPYKELQKRRENHEKWRQKKNAENPAYYRNMRYKASHGISLEEFEARIEAQKGLCPIGSHPFGPMGIKNEDAPCLDHDHNTGKHRAVLCRRHNSAIGFFDDKVSELEAAIEYLKTYQRYPDVDAGISGGH